MGVSAIMSVVSFSVVLAEVFAAVGLCTIVPAAVVTLARLVKNLPRPLNDDGSANPARTTAVTARDDFKKELEKTAAKDVTALVNSIAESLPTLDLLLAKTAKIHAEFTFEGRDEVKGDVQAGMMIDVVTVKAGASALYENKSTNKITLDVDFVSVNVPL